jgi:hypothetical protein
VEKILLLISVWVSTPNNFYVFTCDNLNAYHSLVVQQLIYGADIDVCSEHHTGPWTALLNIYSTQYRFFWGRKFTHWPLSPTKSMQTISFQFLFKILTQWMLRFCPAFGRFVALFLILILIHYDWETLEFVWNFPTPSQFPGHSSAVIGTFCLGVVWELENPRRIPGIVPIAYRRPVDSLSLVLANPSSYNQIGHSNNK